MVKHIKRRDIMRILKGRDLLNMEKCGRLYELGTIVTTEKNKYFHIAVATKEIVKTALLTGENHLSDFLKKDNIIERLNKIIPSSVFLPLAKEEAISEKADEIIRYVRYLRGSGYELKEVSPTRDIVLNGNLITVSADFIFKLNDKIEVVKIKRREPDLSYAGRVFDSQPKNNLELFLLSLLGESMYPDSKTFPSFHHMKSKNDKKGFIEDYNVKKGYNIISHIFSSQERKDVTDRILELDSRIKSGDNDKVFDEQKCRVCPHLNICNYSGISKLQLDEVKETVKAPTDFNLTESQRKAVMFTNGISRINAGAGSGKTTVVALRVVELIMDGCRPEDIILITFTNKGAEEMRDKISYWLKEESVSYPKDRFNITTFNAWGDKLIADNYEAFGFTDKPKIIDKVSKYDILFNILKSRPKLPGFDYKNPVLNFRYAKGAVPKLEGLFDYMKSYDALTEEEIKDKAPGIESIVLDMYKEYNKILKEKNLIEYQDQISLVANAIKDESSALLGENYEHIIVDEYQDSDTLQVDLIKFLAARSKFKSLMVVGDDSQCQPAGTKVSRPNGEQINIEDLIVGDKVLSATVAKAYYPKSEKGTKKVTDISSHIVNNLIEIETETGKISRYTPNHRCFARIHYEGNEEKSVIYLMENEKGQFRVGQTKLFVKGTRDFGLRYRMNQEGAINGWILKICDKNEAWLTEQICAFKFGVPQITWTENASSTFEDIDKLYKEIGPVKMRKRAEKCLDYFGRDINYPIFEKNKNIHFSKKHITEIRACNLMSDFMDVAVPKIKERRWRNTYEKLTSVQNVYYEEGVRVYGLNVEDYETYVADGILTHNSIFGFRNTSQENILKFHKMFNDVEDVQIVENFRSTPEIINLANAINDLNKNKINKKLISGNKSGDTPLLLCFTNQELEHDLITRKIKSLITHGTEPEDIAVIARTKYELFSIERLLRELDVPYVIDIPEPLLNNSNIHIAKNLAASIDSPGLNQGLFEYLFAITNEFEEMEIEEIKELLEEEEKEFTEYFESISLHEGVNEMKRDIFLTMLKIIDDPSLDNFIEGIENKTVGFSDMKEYLDKFIEYEDGKTIDKDGKKYKAVVLTTAHTSKGREYPIVFNTITKYTPENNEKAIEEERRLLFVSLTRAKEKLFVSATLPKENKFKKNYNLFYKEIAETKNCIVRSFKN